LDFGFFLKYQGTPHKTRYTKTYRGESEEKPQDMGTGEKFLNRTAMACAVRSRFNKWDLIKLQNFHEAKKKKKKKKLSIRQKSCQQIGEGTLPILNLIGEY
jgi:hypothetical protein